MAFIVKVGQGAEPKAMAHWVAGALDIIIGDEDKNVTRWEYKQ